jgi:hypothetical protein
VRPATRAARAARSITTAGRVSAGRTPLTRRPVPGIIRPVTRAQGAKRRPTRCADAVRSRAVTTPRPRELSAGTRGGNGPRPELLDQESLSSAELPE